MAIGLGSFFVIIGVLIIIFAKQLVVITLILHGLCIEHVWSNIPIFSEEQLAMLKKENVPASRHMGYMLLGGILAAFGTLILIRGT